MNSPKYVEFHLKNKFEKLVYLVGFIIRNKIRKSGINTFVQVPLHQSQI
jgi:hypothetical protein